MEIPVEWLPYSAAIGAVGILAAGILLLVVIVFVLWLVGAVDIERHEHGPGSDERERGCNGKGRVTPGDNGGYSAGSFDPADRG